MKNLSFNYSMKIKFNMPVSEHYFTVKCIPESNERQNIQNLVFSVFPDNDLSEGRDSFGNRCIYGQCRHPHNHFHILVKGEAAVGLSMYETGEEKHIVAEYL